MKRIILTIFLCAGLFSASFAQKKEAKAKKTPQEKAQQATDELNKKLSLTPEQKSKIYAINLTGFSKTKTEKVKDGKKDKAAIKAAKAERDQKISAVLNESQRKNFEVEKAAKKTSKKEGKKKS
ncbi:MAG: hypothetical protein V4594_22400 [Bacteroidota bacterium]